MNGSNFFGETMRRKTALMSDGIFGSVMNFGSLASLVKVLVVKGRAIKNHVIRVLLALEARIP